MTFHILPSAHLDPVWLWDWREGLNEGLITVRTVLDLMEEYPELTFIRGESSIYDHIERTDPRLFDRVVNMISSGRWDVVGGTVVQPDTNLVSTEILCREFERGLSYFERRLGVRPTAAWLADSFGHSAGFPNILSAFGMENFAFTRPQRSEFPLESPAFWWEADTGARILCYRQHWKWYCSERDNISLVLEETLEKARLADYRNVGVLCGLGNHGGGPTRRHLREIEEWRAAHPEIKVRFSTLHGFFRELRAEVCAQRNETVPSVRGELGYCLRGCYSSVQKFKGAYRRAEALVAAAETTRSIIGALVGGRTMELEEAWDALAFNAFHDIVPGSSIERAYEDQLAWVGAAAHRAHKARHGAMNILAAAVDTRVPPPRHPDRPTDIPFLVWNPLPKPFRGLVEFEGSLDYRPIYAFEGRASEVPLVVAGPDGKDVPFQEIATEHSSMPHLPWRKRVLVPVEIPALGWSQIRLGWRDEPVTGADNPHPAAHSPSEGVISAGNWRISTKGEELLIERDGVNFFSGARNLELRVVEDGWGSWGGMNEEKDSFQLEKHLEDWHLSHSEVLEGGPLRAKLWTRWKGRSSHMDLTFSVDALTDWVHVEGRLLWNERSARLKLVLPCAGATRCEVPGSAISRDVEGQVPVGRWITRTTGSTLTGFASDVLSDADATADELRITIARASRYANDVETRAEEELWRPAVDSGELKFQFRLFDGAVEPDVVVDDLLFPPVPATVPATSGRLPRTGSLGRVFPETVKLLSAELAAADRLKVRLQNREDGTMDARLVLGTSDVSIGELRPGEIRTLIVKKSKSLSEGWRIIEGDALPDRTSGADSGKSVDDPAPKGSPALA